jgi:hypothetical protein
MKGRFHMSRAMQVPKGAVKVASKASSAVAYLGVSAAGKVMAIGFYGKADNPAFHYSFRSVERRAAYVAGWFKDRDASAARKKEEAAKKAAAMAKPHGLKVGDVLSGMWGYDQTNVEFWQVTKVIGKRSVEIRELCCESVETGFMSGNCVPLVDQFTKREPELRRVNELGSVKLFSWGCYLSKVEPVVIAGVKSGYRAAGWTAYA